MTRIKIDPDLRWVLLVLIGFTLVLAVLAWAIIPTRASWLPSQTWAWQAVPNATSYRVYWSASGQVWCDSNRLNLRALKCVDGVCQLDIPMPPSKMAFIVVTAVNANGQSVTEHGPIVAVCP